MNRPWLFLILMSLLTGCSGASSVQNAVESIFALSSASKAGTNPAQLTPSDSTTVEPGAAAGTVATTGPSAGELLGAPANQPISEKAAFRLLQQASFGPSEAGIAEVKAKGPRRWLAEQFAMPVSVYGSRDRDAVHRWPDKNTDFCSQFVTGTPERYNCWRDWFSSDPIKLDFFKQASLGTDQLRQRMGFALSQILVVSEVEVTGTYGLADYFQMLREQSFATYRDVLLATAKHPAMGVYLNMVNNDATDPNENFARELLQLFSIGTCELNIDGTLKTGQCLATYDMAMVREYAYALTGWTYPLGGVNPWCPSDCEWKNPLYLKGSMAPVATQHDSRPRTLLGGATLAIGHGPEQAMVAVVDSLMNHPNTAPFMAKRFIQAFVTSNPSPAYVARVATAFNAGQYETFGGGRKGDLKATLAAVILDEEARNEGAFEQTNTGMLRDPVVMMVNVVRALNGYTDGERMGNYAWGSNLAQAVFNSPSVFNFYSPDYPLPGNPDMVAPQFQIAGANTNVGWVNFVNDVIYWWYNFGDGLAPKAEMQGTTGTKLSFTAFEGDADVPTVLADRLDRLLTGGKLGPPGQALVVQAMGSYTFRDLWLADPQFQTTWRRERVKTAAYLILASPHFQVQR
jgi:uncharacterized protein (DUF1800 family)